MYATLNYNKNASVANILSDVVAVLTGETLVGNLSSNLSALGTSIDATVPAGWTVHDNVSATQVVITAPITDSARSKFLSIESTASNKVVANWYKSWDNVTHTGVPYFESNGTTIIDGVIVNQTTPETYTSVIALSASAKHIMGSYLSNNETTFAYPWCITDFVRTPGYWDTNVNDYPPIAFIDNADWKTAAAWYIPEGPLGPSTNYDISAAWNAHADATPVTHMMTHGSTFVSASKLTHDMTVLDANKNIITNPLMPFGVRGDDGWHLGGDISSLCDIYMMPSYGGWGDVMTVNTNEYRIIPFGTPNYATTEYYLAVKVK